MHYRYFYNITGTIVGVCSYRSNCFQQEVVDSVGYIDSDLDVSIDEYSVDTVTKQLVKLEND